MMKSKRIPIALGLLLIVPLTTVTSQPAESGAVDSAPQRTKLRSGNPVFSGWYADPEAAIFRNEYWIYPTYSAPYDQQVFFDAFSSPDLVHWTKHSRILTTNEVRWARRAMWAPAVAERKGRRRKRSKRRDGCFTSV